MKTTIKTLIIAFLFIGNAALAQTAKLISPKEFKQKIENTKNIQIIDIRTPKEYKGDHLQGAININYYDKDFKEQIAKLDKTKPTFVYCHSAGRSGHSMKTFKKLKFNTIYDMNKGIVGWRKEHFETVK